MSDLHDQPAETADLAAEYAVGILDAVERRAAERRMRVDSAFAADVAWWENRLAPLFSEISGTQAPPAVWTHVSRDIDRIAKVSATYRNHARPEANGSRGIGSVSPIWRTLAFASSLLAVASLAAIAILMPPDGSTMNNRAGDTTFAARLASDSGEVFFTVVVDLQNQTATLIPVDGMADEARVPELWLIADEAPGPRSLGVIETAHPLKMRLHDMGTSMPGSTLAVSLEPQGGSPTGSPTGPVVASGALDRI